jgi:hypothetical protein
MQQLNDGEINEQTTEHPFKRISATDDTSARSGISSIQLDELRATVREASKRAQLVDLEDLVKFVFPSELQHAMSTGRMLAFGLYGPLDGDARLRSGHKVCHRLGVHRFLLR